MKEFESKDDDPFFEFKEGYLSLEFPFERVQSQADYNGMKLFYQRRFSERAGREIPIEEIGVSPKAGEKFLVTQHIRIKLDEPFYVGLEDIQKENPTALPRLVHNLEKFGEVNNLDEEQQALLRYTLNGLREIIERR